MADVDGELTLIVNGVAYAGWTRVRLTLGIEVCPPVFDIGLTEKFPGETSSYMIRRGDSCQVRMGNRTIITGWIDRVRFEITPDSHSLRIVGRGLTSDLVDCSAEWPGGQISGSNAAEIATKLCAPYGIGVTLLADPGPAIPQFNFMLGETAWEIIERVCRFAGLLVYEGSDGKLLLTQVATTPVDGVAIKERVNVERASISFNQDQRFSEYHVYLMSEQVLGDVGQGGNLITIEKDAGIKRNRKRFIIAEAPAGGQDITRKRAAWERSRRVGRGNIIEVTVSSWGDGAGDYWTPGTLIPVALPSCRMSNYPLILSHVTFLRDEQGTRAEMELMMPAAFSVEPVMILPLFADLV